MNKRLDVISSSSAMLRIDSARNRFPYYIEIWHDCCPEQY
jgi:hypothetical protein